MLTYNLRSFFDESSFFFSKQYGFRKNKNNELAGLTLVNRLPPALEHELYAIFFFYVSLLVSTHFIEKIYFKKLTDMGLEAYNIKIA